MDFMRPKKNGIQPGARKINIVRVASASKPAPLPSKIQQERRLQSSSTSSRPPNGARSSYSPASSGNGNTRKRKPEREHRARALSSSPETEGDEGDRGKDTGKGVKRVKVVDRNRRLKSRVAFAGTSGSGKESGGNFAMIHAADIASPARADNREGYREDMVIKLQYPSDSQKERCVFIFCVFLGYLAN